MTQKYNLNEVMPSKKEDLPRPEENTFKCRVCGEKHLDSFCSTNDVGICRWCSGEEEE